MKEILRAKTQRTAKLAKALRALRFFAYLRETSTRKSHETSTRKSRETSTRKSIVSIVAVTLLVPSTLLAQRANHLTPAKPESAGMSSARLSKIDEAIL